MTLIYLADCGTTELSPLDRIAGLSFADRVFRAARRAGYRRVLVWAAVDCHSSAAHAIADLATRVADLRVDIASTPADWEALLSADAEMPYRPDTIPAARVGVDLGRPGITIVMPGVVVSPRLLASAETVGVGPMEQEIIAVPAGPLWPRTGVYRTTVANARQVERLCEFARAEHATASAMPSGPDIALKRAPLVARAATRADLPEAEETVRRAMFKPNDTYLGRLNRRMSLPISVWLLAHTPMSANALSLMLVALGLLAAWLFSLGTYLGSVAGALLSLAASILDGSDGEIARLTYEESAFGCWVETIGDYSYYLGLFVGMAVGAVRATGHRSFAAMGRAQSRGWY